MEYGRTDWSALISERRVQEMEAANVDDCLWKFVKEEKDMGWKLEGKVE